MGGILEKVQLELYWFQYFILLANTKYKEVPILVGLAWWSFIMKVKNEASQDKIMDCTLRTECHE